MSMRSIAADGFATGWSIEATIYQMRFYELMRDIFNARDHIRVENYEACFDYLSAWGISCALDVFGSLTQASTEDTQLLSLVHQRIRTVETALGQELLAHKFVIDSSQAVNLLSGGERIETVRFCLP